MNSNIPSNHDSTFSHSRALLDNESQEMLAILQRSAQNIVSIIGGDKCSIALFEPEESQLFTYSTAQQPGEKLDRTHIELHEDLESWITRQRTARITTMLAPVPPPHAFAISPTDSLLSLPLIEGELFLGILTVSGSRPFSEQSEKIFPALADQLAVTIHTLLQAASERQQRARAQASFFSMMTHELRSPLNSINGYLELALSGAAGELNEQQHEFVQRARMGSEHLYALLENLLLIARADNGQMQLNRELIRLQDVLDNAIEEMELSAADQHITIEVNDVRTFPKIYADAVRLRQVLRNLIGNALNFTPAGGRITINASFVRPGHGSPSQDDEEMGNLIVKVHDTGIGIAPEYHTRIFERFFQLTHEARGRAGGLGLGLPIAKMIVELHGGSITVESQPDKGSTFTCILPCVLP